MFGIHHAFIPTALRVMGFCLVFVILGAAMIIALERSIRRGFVHSKRTRFFIIAFGLCFIAAGLFGIGKFYYRFHTASRIIATCPPQPAWVSTYAEKEPYDQPEGPTYVYLLYADIAPRDAATFPARRKIEIEQGVQSGNLPSPIVTNVPGEVYLPHRGHLVVIVVEGKYLCSN